MSDSADRNIVIFIFLFTFIYINYLRIKIDIKNNWENMRCNPLNLWTSSFFKDEKTSNSQFKECINSLSSQSIENGLQTAYKKQADAMAQIGNQENVLKGHFNNVDNNIDQTLTQYNINETKIDDIKQKQTTYKTINQLLSTKDTDTNSLYNFTTNVRNIFNNIQSYLPSITTN